MKKGFLFISCDEAKHICDKSQYDEATSWEKVKLNIRLSWCRITKAYYKRNTKLTEVLNTAKPEALSPSERDSLASKFKEELSKH